MSRPAVITALLVAPMLTVLTGCFDKVYDGSQSFYDQHPAYREQPSYFQPPDPDNPDPHANRPW